MGNITFSFLEILRILYSKIKRIIRDKKAKVEILLYMILFIYLFFAQKESPDL